jgi:hypothetical protein
MGGLSCPRVRHLVGGSCFIDVIFIYLCTAVSNLNFHIRWCSCGLRVIWLVPHVQQETLYLSVAHRSPCIWVVLVLLNLKCSVLCCFYHCLSFCIPCCVVSTIVCLFVFRVVLFLPLFICCVPCCVVSTSVCLFVLLLIAQMSVFQFTASDYHCAIFKLV